MEEINHDMTNVTKLEKGDIVKGKVSKIEEKQALIDLAYKYDGILPIGEISNIHIDNVTDAINVGDELELKVIRINDDEEKLIVSKRVVDRDNAWETLKQRLESGEIFEVKVAEVVKGGLVADVGLRGFVPASLVETHFVEDFTDYKGKTLRVKVVELDEAKNKVILSQRAVLEEEAEGQKKEVVSKIKPGDIKEGIVQRLTDFGAFVDIGGVDGLVHISEISWDRVDKPSDVLKEGENVKVKVLRVDPDNQKVSLSIKETEKSPFGKALEQFKIGNIYTGKVKRIVSFGAFVEIADHVEGLVHISQISNQHISQPSEVLGVGQEVKVKILDIDASTERVSLSIREAEELRNDGNAQIKEYEASQSGFNITLGDVLGDKLKNLK